ncbi:GLUG motif-containing protein [Barnesiella intestinihominis]|jgi:GLUG domain protein subfamily|uniref:GLUG motif-containing protein n=1 Tax=Barnesiella intestinihominis TaxID=487174 RepID=UPI00189D4A77|nr:GLUG motif-containing protein [Barnesiella intestinihominis]MDB0670961.1 GLUG motif-containing protein [Barnesiella intestinihominis]
MMKNFYKKLSFVMVMGISLSSYAAWNGDATAWTQGDGSEQNPFLIENEAQLSHLQQTVTAGETYQGKYFRMTADLDMGGKQMPSIGHYNDYTTQENPELVRESKVFRGTFDGDFHTIDNLTIVSNNAEATLGGLGLFAVSYPETRICNLTLGQGVTVEGSEFDNVGGFVGYSAGGNVENCRILGTVNGGGMNVGGIVGSVEESMTITGCVNAGRLVGHSFAGGIVGYANLSKIQNCYSSAVISCPLASWVGGILGWAVESTVNNCYAIGPVEAEVGSIWMPGKSPICSELEKSTAADCYYVEALTGCKPLSEQAGVTAVTEEEMKAADMIAKLNANLSANAWGAGADGFPALLWEIDRTGSIESAGATAGIEIIKEGDRLVVVSATGERARLSVYDITGKAIVTAVVSDGDCVTVPGKGVCIVALVTDDGNCTTHKFLF